MDSTEWQTRRRKIYTSACDQVANIVDLMDVRYKRRSPLELASARAFVVPTGICEDPITHSQSPLFKLPNELLARILQYLSNGYHPNRVCFALSCKLLLSVGQHCGLEKSAGLDRRMGWLRHYPKSDPCMTCLFLREHRACSWGAPDVQESLKTWVQPSLERPGRRRRSYMDDLLWKDVTTRFVHEWVGSEMKGRIIGYRTRRQSGVEKEIEEEWREDFGAKSRDEMSKYREGNKCPFCRAQDTFENAERGKLLTTLGYYIPEI